MRLIGTLSDIGKARHFCSFLSGKKISNQCEITKNKDWGSEQYGDLICEIWILDEDRFEEAATHFKEFDRQPENPQYDALAGSKSFEKKHNAPVKEIPAQRFRASTAPQKTASHPIGRMTLCLTALCVVIFLWGRLTAPGFEPYPSYLPATSVLSPPIDKELLYDYPKKIELADQLIQTYGLEKLSKPDQLPDDGKSLLEKYLKTPMWNGFYGKIVHSIKNKKLDVQVTAPLFEKIKQGEFWRLLTPCFLHSNLLHLFFNMAWLVILGRQIESRIGKARYLILTVAAGLFSNTAQYLMSGPNFVGYSGILCAMIIFVWIRQKNAPWEGYFLHPSTMNFIALFIVLMAGIQLAGFFSEIYLTRSFNPGIANTAHLSGAAAGYMLGRLNYFKWAPK